MLWIWEVSLKSSQSVQACLRVILPRILMKTLSDGLRGVREAPAGGFLVKSQVLKNLSLLKYSSGKTTRLVRRSPLQAPTHHFL